MANEKNVAQVPKNAPADPYSIDAEVAELEELNAALSAVTDEGIQTGLVEYLTPQIATPQMVELLQTQPQVFVAALVEGVGAYLQENYWAKIERMEALTGQIRIKDEDREFARQKDALLKANPDADLKKLYEYYQNDLSKNAQNDLANNPEFLAALYEAYQKANAPAAPVAPAPLPQSSAEPAPSGANSGYISPARRY